ncbi:MAG: hypothetical protein BGO37_16260 [Cellulomonas sp. 73-92]|uniref:DUF4235 domain-containing protein n=1 Tax=Cellulomonas sp. 73-92 TaxID=1895740 RepID=UPI00092B23C0|nr:DUF4235 domain-containing protein [Cellulomonas sp. 73-92]OJV81047.1 MAG: hypothetical protein BGO37_16260 [Cellulomonas sp. 73-92]
MPEKSPTVLRVAGIGAGLLGAWLVHKVLDAAWRSASGHPTPDPADRDAPLAEVIVATALTGALVALMRLLATRGTQRAAGAAHH